MALETGGTNGTQVCDEGGPRASLGERGIGGVRIFEKRRKTGRFYRTTWGTWTGPGQRGPLEGAGNAKRRRISWGRMPPG